MKQALKDHLQAVPTGTGLVQWEKAAASRFRLDENGVCACQSM